MAEIDFDARWSGGWLDGSIPCVGHDMDDGDDGDSGVPVKHGGILERMARTEQVLEDQRIAMPPSPGPSPLQQGADKPRATATPPLSAAAFRAVLEQAGSRRMAAATSPVRWIVIGTSRSWPASGRPLTCPSCSIESWHGGGRSNGTTAHASASAPSSSEHGPEPQHDQHRRSRRHAGDAAAVIRSIDSP